MFISAVYNPTASRKLMNADIHNYKRRFERTLERIESCQDISSENKETIFSFKDYLISEGIGFAKIERYLGDMAKFSRMLNKSFSDSDKGDIRRVIANLEQEELSAETKKCFKVMVRKLYRFIRGFEEKGEYPPEVKWISISIPKNHKKLPEELLTEEEILKMIQRCNCPRDKALLSTLAESGCRISEIGNMKIKNISFEEYGARLTVNGKTGMRKVLVINSSPYLEAWINNHPYNENPESFIWVSTFGKLLSYTRIISILKQSAKKAGIKKRVYAHLFRHSRATHLASIMTEANMKQYFGWGQDSKMCGIYIHMNGNSTDSAILRANGIELDEQKKENILQNKKCLRCNKLNGITARLCDMCGLPLDKEEAEKRINDDIEKKKADEIMNSLIKDPEILELIKKKLSN
jgi:integrase/recombinase XerD